MVSRRTRTVEGLEFVGDSKRPPVVWGTLFVVFPTTDNYLAFHFSEDFYSPASSLLTEQILKYVSLLPATKLNVQFYPGSRRGAWNCLCMKDFLDSIRKPGQSAVDLVRQTRD